MAGNKDIPRVQNPPSGDYGEVAWLSARKVDDAGLLSLETISGSTLSLGIGRLALSAPELAVPAAAIGASGAAALAGVVALFWTSSLGDNALYTEDQLRSLKQARTCSSTGRATG
nr:hypothetical protein [Pseudomonas sp. ANT_H12B]